MKKFTVFYQLLALLSILFMFINICLNGEMRWFDIDLMILLFVSAFILTYLKSYIEMYKQETVKWEKCYIAFSMCLPIIHLLVGCIYCVCFFCNNLLI